MGRQGSPFVAFRAEFDQTMLERGMKDLFGVPVGFAWIDLAFLLPALFRGTECDSLDDWAGALRHRRRRAPRRGRATPLPPRNCS